MSIKRVDTLELPLPIRVYYEDTDAGGIVYYANFLKFFERARTEYLRYFGIEQDVWLANRIGFVVRRTEVDNLAPARFNQQLTVFSKISRLKRASLHFDQYVVDEKENVLCRGNTLIACVNFQEMKPIPIPNEIVEVIVSAS